MARSTDNPKSRYVQGGTTEELEKRLGWWERTIIPKRDDDMTYTIPVSKAGRPDLISYEIYGTPDFMWLVMQYNNILDPTLELTAGVELRLPTAARVSISIITR